MNDIIRQSIVNLAEKSPYVSYADLHSALSTNSDRELEELLIQAIYEGTIEVWFFFKLMLFLGKNWSVQTNAWNYELESKCSVRRTNLVYQKCVEQVGWTLRKFDWRLERSCSQVFFTICFNSFLVLTSMLKKSKTRMRCTKRKSKKKKTHCKRLAKFLLPIPSRQAVVRCLVNATLIINIFDLDMGRDMKRSKNAFHANRARRH